MKKILFLLVAAAIFSACNNDDDEVTFHTNFTSIATVENPSKSAAFYFRLDNNDLMWVQATNFPNYRPKDGQRIIAGYNILSVNNSSTLYNHKVSLYSVYEVLTKGIFKIKPSNQDSIGNDPVEIKDMWIGSDYLNVDFVYPGFNKTHYISLVSDTTKKYTDGRIHLEFRHNDNDDAKQQYTRGIVSFDLRSLKTGTTTDSIKLTIHTREFGSPENRTYNLSYKFGIKAAVSKRFTIPREITNIR